MRNIAFVLMLAAALFGQSSEYRITHTYLLGGDGSWDYVVPDPPAHRVFLARQNRVMVVDENDGKLLGEVMGTNGAHGTAIVHSVGVGFATSGNDQSVVEFDLKTFRSTYGTSMLRRGFDVRTVQHWMGHKSLKTTMRYLAPAPDVHDRLDLIRLPVAGTNTVPKPLAPSTTHKAPKRHQATEDRGI